MYRRPTEVYSEQDWTFGEIFQIYWIKVVDAELSLEQLYAYITF